MTGDQNIEADKTRAQACNAGTNTQCSICLGNFKNPKILPCTHNFCETPCLQNLLKSVTGNTFRCPLCRLEFPVPPTGTQSFASNTNVEQIVAIHSPHAATDDADTQCSICLGNFRHPKILPCSHNFCEKPCLQKLLNSADGDNFRCPLCRQQFSVPLAGTSAFPYNRDVLHTSLTQTIDIPLSCRRGNTRTPLSQETCFQSNESLRVLLDTHQPPVYQSISETPELPRESHLTASANRCCGSSCCTEGIFLLCKVAFMVMAIVFYCVTSTKIISINMIVIVNYNLLRGIFDIATAVATKGKKVKSGVIFTVYSTMCLICGLVFIWDCAKFTDGDQSCYIVFGLDARYYSIFDAFVTACFVMYNVYGRCCI